MGEPCWYIYGAGGFGAETADIIRAAMAAGTEPPHDLCYVVDDPDAQERDGIPIVPLTACEPGACITIGVGEPALRRTLAQRAAGAGLCLRSAIAPSAIISPSAHREEGVIIAPLCSVQARARLGRNVAVNTMAIIGHDVSVAADAVISSMVNLGGAVRIGAGSYVGMGALVKEDLSCGADSIIGMGSVVHRDVPDRMIAMGDPARPVRRNEDGRVFRKIGAGG